MKNNFFQALLAVLLLVVALLYVLSNTDIQMFQFPYHVEIWGTIADWLMFFVTALTAWYLVKTFKSQQEITRIEQNNFRLKVLPKLEGSFDGNKSIKIKVLEHPILALRTYFIKLNRFKYFNMYHHEREYDKGAEIASNTTFEILIEGGDGIVRRKQLYDEIILFFLDSQSNLYKQTILFTPNYNLVRPQTPICIRNLIFSDEFEKIVDEIVGLSLIKNKDR